MNDTLKLLRPFIDMELKQYSLNELALMYQETPETKILATAYDKIFKLAIIIKNKYFGLTEEDVASFCIEKLEFCLRTYKPGNEFTTYFVTAFNNVLRTETQALNCKKRKCILQSINDLIYIGVEDTYDLLDLLLNSISLSDKEYKLCILLSKGYDTNYISEELKVSKTTVYNMEKALQSKLIIFKK